MNSVPESPVALGSTDLRVSPVGVGTNSWGAKGEVDPGKRATYEALIAAGINLFDTAEIYTGGRSEITLGQCIRDTATQPLVLTKFFPMPWRLPRCSPRPGAAFQWPSSGKYRESFTNTLPTAA